MSDGAHAKLLDYLVEEEKGRLYRRASLCHLGPVQLNPFSCIETVDPIRARATAPPQSLVSGFGNLSFSNDGSYLNTERGMIRGLGICQRSRGIDSHQLESSSFKLVLE